MATRTSKKKKDINIIKKTNKTKTSKKFKKNNMGIVIVIVLMITIIALIAVFTYSYALWMQTHFQSTPNLVATGCFNVSLTDINNEGTASSINLNNTYPLSDNKGKKLTPYQFTISNTCNVKAQYKIALSSLNNSTLNKQYIKYMFNDSNSNGAINLLTSATITSLDNETLSIINNNNNPYTVISSYLMAEGSLNAGESKTYNLRLWMDSNASYQQMNQTFNGVISVTSISS